MGIDQVKSLREKFIDGKKVALITNNSARNGEGRPALDIIRELGGYRKLTLLTPEHGYFGDFQSGETVESYFDQELGVEVESMYRAPERKQRKIGNQPVDIDQEMREIDSIKDPSKYISKEIAQQFDTIIFDLQDVGCRIYTYIATMIYVMETISGTEIDFVVLDRPNPIQGKEPDGPILLDSQQSFIGALPVPIKHSLTIGELANFYNMRISHGNTRLSVVKMKGWKRGMWYDQLGISWAFPSPNMPTLETATVYPGSVLLEGTNVSEGRGTTKPFQIIGAPWLNPKKVLSLLKNSNIRGVLLNEVKFKPYFSKYSEEKCNGIMLNVTGRNVFKPFEFAIYLLSSISSVHGDKFAYHDHYFDSVAGNPAIRKGIVSGERPDSIIEGYQPELSQYIENLSDIVLY